MRKSLQLAGITLKALKELGPVPLGLYLVYQIGLRSGWIRQQTQSAVRKASRTQIESINQYLIPIPDQDKILALLSQESVNQIIEEAEEICSGNCRIFSAQTVPLINPSVPMTLDWTRCDLHTLTEDVKLIWEPGRFGWVYSLGMAYILTGRNTYPQAFWELCESFFTVNPPYLGWQWVSAQEVALRLMSLVYASQVFAKSSTFSSKRIKKLAYWIEIHARRIPPSLIYARSQQNNHLLSEAAGLFTAGMALPLHPEAERWKKVGWDLFVQGLDKQISTEGVYCQHSTNYHRLMLQLVVWMDRIRESSNYDWPAQTRVRIQSAGKWIASLLDSISGQVPNLGPNDGAYIFPLTHNPFHDYRPVLQALWASFFPTPLFPPGPWDDLGLWLGIDKTVQIEYTPKKLAVSDPLTIHHDDIDSWCYLRTAKFKSRPGHADLLHLDIWWKGLNIAQDAGTYLYNASSPWDNALTHTAVHNTITINDTEQMRRTGRFLYLNWATAVPDADSKVYEPSMSASHSGYNSIGWQHKRKVSAQSYGWQVVDLVSKSTKHQNDNQMNFRLHWLLPDYEYELHPNLKNGSIQMQMTTRFGIVLIQISISTKRFTQTTYTLARAGKLIAGDGPVKPVSGWISPTYNQKLPALSFSVQIKTNEPVTFITDWTFLKS